MNQDININGTNFNVAANASLTEVEFLDLHKDKFKNDTEAKKAYKDIKAAGATAPESQ
jgi:hypothetical protein